MVKKKMFAVATVALLCMAVLFGGALYGCTTSGTQVTDISIVKELSMEVGKRASLYPEIDTNNGKEYMGIVSWSSSDEEIATVKSGVVSAISEGSATVTVEVPGTEYSSSCVVTVYKANILRVGIKTDVKGFGYYNPNTRSYEGMEVDLGKMISDALGYTDVEYVPLNADEREEALYNDEVDCVIATYSITSERAELLDFSASYYTDYVRVLALKSYAENLEKNNIRSLREYLLTYRKTCAIGTVSGTTAYAAFMTYCDGEDISITDNLGYDLYENIEYEDYAAAEQALEAGDEIQLFCGDYSILSGYKTDSDVFLDDKLESQDYGVATMKDSELSESIDALIDQWLEDGTMDLLSSEWVAG